MLNDKNFGVYVLNSLRELCKKCDKAPNLKEDKLSHLQKYESVKKWQGE